MEAVSIHEFSNSTSASRPYSKTGSALSERETNDIFNDLDVDKDGYVSVSDLEAKINDVLAAASRDGRLRPQQSDPEKSCTISDRSDDPQFSIRDILHDLPEDQEKLSRADFVRCARHWTITNPRKDPNVTLQQQKPRIPFTRRWRAYWAVHGPSTVFITFVVLAQLGCGYWQMFMYEHSALARETFGPGIVVAKFCAGALYPTLTFMLLAMSRSLNTLLRRSYVLSRFINYDHSQKFHGIMAVVALLLATAHGIAHMSGDLLQTSRPDEWANVLDYLGPDTKLPLTYAGKMRTLPVITGLIALGLFWLIALLSMPFIRKRKFEIFQLGHLLMYPFIGLLCAHGTAAYFQEPMLGYWLAFPFLLVIIERSHRLIRGFRPVMATTRILDGQALVLTCKHPQGRNWRYSTGQYVLVQCPEISLFQWHPFTVSSCRGTELEVHIKRSGDWTAKLMDSFPENQDVRVSIDGPFGAPAQRFYDYDYSIVIGSGIGVTPCSAILSDLDEKYGLFKDPWTEHRNSRGRLSSRSLAPKKPARVYAYSVDKRTDSTSSSSSDLGPKASSDLDSSSSSLSSCETLHSSAIAIAPSLLDSLPPSRSSSMPQFEKFQQPRPTSTRRVDIHWTVREISNLSWFSDLLNRAIDRADQLSQSNALDLRVNTYITTRWKDFASQIFASLIDRHHTPSALTSLKQPSHFGRPDFTEILERHFQDVSKETGRREKKVGVFYCGAPAVGELLSDLCRQLTARARSKGMRVRYVFHTEVFD